MKTNHYPNKIKSHLVTSIPMTSFTLKSTSKILTSDINAELEKVNTWLKLNKLSLNEQKTKLMLFHRK